ncbi:DUF4129 domain-containing transglutaminase family protein [Sporosarcina limicola]|uniref:Transglutaminase-like domain-containing protein n=1 Tax=Sporosarcina limicola TaxID=34101 RepID=A0A927MMI8_9BACL|nr:transglutaminase domain-containing protein [Sporosarcina limicola]MBE1556731.1 hypothetical protein [Sporosarcina limicola]
MNGIGIDRRLLALLYILAFLLLREWLIPVIVLTDTGYLWLFLVFIAMTFLMALVGAKWWVTVPIKIIYVVWAVHYVFLEKVFFTKETAVQLLPDILSNTGIIMGGNWENLTNPFRTILFFLLLWMTTYLIRHWIEVRRSIFLFYVMTVIFIAFIDTFSPFSADAAIFRIMLTGLMLLGLLYISRLAEKHHVVLSMRSFIAISAPLLVVVTFSGAFANLLPKQEPIWPDPLPYFKSIVQGTGEGGMGTGISTSGYDPDDSALGGSFEQDDTLVLEAKVASKQYWKIETKNTYTSKGWEQNSASESHMSYTMGGELGGMDVSASDSPRQQAQLKVAEEFPFLLYPYGIRRVSAAGNVILLHAQSAGQYRTVINGIEGALDAYEIDFQEPKYSMKQLRATTMDDFATSNEDFSPYLQLPDQLPGRVKELADEIVGKYDSVYEKTKAIEMYFGRNGFVYAQQDIVVPKVEDDYVDQFLFDTKRGYCDNFSTSMVVMLRSADIPARWVKGFAPGEAVKDANGEHVYRVTNNEAHSWVEAYMPGIGWMPFEPTIGFSGQSNIDFDIELDLGDPEAPAMKEKEKQKPKKPEKPNKAEKSFEIDKLFESLNNWVKNNVWKLIVGIFILGLISWGIYAIRVRWLPKLLIQFHRSEKSNWKTFSTQYKSLLKQLDRYGIKRASGMTLSEYAIEIDEFFGGEKMRVLTQAYEKGLYGGNTTDQEWGNLKEMWEDLINRTSG